VKFGSILLLAIGLAMDATAVSAARGLAARRIVPRHVLLVALFFGGFQGLMPLLGWFIGSRVGPALQAWDHWIVFVLLGAIGGKMLWSAGDEQAAAARSDQDLFGMQVMFVLAVATSIDALAVGFTLPMLKAPMVVSLLTIGVTTAVLSAVGLLVGRRLGGALGPRLDMLGGLVLIGLGAKILVEHLLAG
jgi:manganese efflux pump family protein